MPSARSVLTLAASLAVTAGTLAVTTAPARAAEDLPALLVTEINVDSSNRTEVGGSSVDAFEFVEVHNTTDAAINLTDAGYSVVYASGSTQKTLTHGAGATVPAHGTLVMWPRHSGFTGAAALTEQDFRDFYTGLGWTGSYDVAVLEGQNGLNNSGSTLWLRHTAAGTTTDVAQVSWVATEKGVDKTVEYAAPADGTAVQRVLATQQDPNPGVVRDEQLDTTPPPTPPTAPELFVSEVLPDNGSHTFTDAGGVQRTSTQDNFELIEVANTTSAAIDLADYSLVYNGTATLSLAAGTPRSVPAHGTLVLWLDYQTGSADGWSSGSPNSSLFTDADFRSHYGMPAGTPVGHVTGQAGLANSGTRSIELRTAAGAVSRSTYVAANDIGPELSAHYSAPGVGAIEAPVFASKAAPTPGVLAPGQGVTPPEETGVPAQPPAPPTDPSLKAPVLQVTEVAPDTANAGGGDAYEFVEVYNASDAPVQFRDFVLTYLYIDANAVTTNQALWPATPRDAVIDPGQTLVLWVRNGTNEALGQADFNAAFGAHLTLGEDLVEVHTAGMSNGGLRGIRVATDTGIDTSTTYYFDDAQTTPTTAIQYAWNPADSPDHLWVPQPRNGTVQTMTGLATPTPGYTHPDQVPAGLVRTPANDTAPTIDDLTGGPLLPETEDLTLGFDVRDDHQVRTAELTLATDVGDPIVRSLQFESPERFVYTVPAVDLYGKQWVDYTLEVSDGTHTTTLGPVRIDLSGGPRPPVRLNHADGDFLSGDAPITATTDGDPADLSLTIDDQQVGDAVPSLEASPRFAFEATNTDAFFRNGVKIGDEVLTVFDEGYYERTVTVSADVPLEKVVQGQQVTLGIYAGTKAWPDPDPNENNDDFVGIDPRLALPDGRVLRPVSCASAGEGQQPTTRACPAPDARIGFNDASLVYFLATFDVPADAFDSVLHQWDTTAVADGEHTVAAAAGAGTASRTLVVDNSAPQITSSVADGAKMRGSFDVDATATDAGSGLESLTATLDGEEVTLPHPTSSVELEPGDHEVVLTAVDVLGNTRTRTVAFTTPEEQPSATLRAPADGAEVPSGEVALQATPSDPEGDVLDVELRRGFHFAADDEAVTAKAGVANDASRVTRDGAVLLTQEELAAITTEDGLAATTASKDLFPYQLFTVDVPEGAGDDFTARIHWSGSANAEARVGLHVLDVTAGEWDQVDEHLTTGGAPTDFDLDALVPAADHVQDGRITVLVQHSEGFTTPGQSRRGDQVAPYSGKGVTPRDQYDFTVAWESDTQYYNQNPDFYPHQRAIHDFLVAQRSNLDLQYLMHTGDIVNDWDQPAQWQRADVAYRDLDEAGIPYNVLAGNHDVGHHSNDYGAYGRWFGEARYAGNPWYGGSHENNRGSYNLVSADGIDLMVVTMGWGAGDPQIRWMNRVIREHPERKVIINLHEFMLTTGGLGPIPQRIMDEVVRTNPNVIAVGSGHYHDAYTRTDEMDDDGDGVADRTVYSMLFDYQGLPEGGLGYLRLLHFDNDGGRIIVRTYSPSLDDFDSDDPSLDQVHQEFEIPYAASGLQARTKELSTDELSVDILTTETIEAYDDVASGTALEATWTVDPGEHGWYVRTADPYGAVDHSVVHTFTATGSTDPTDPPTPEPTDPPTTPPTTEPTTQPTPVPGAVVPGTPAVSGRARVGETLTVDPGAWAAGTSLAYSWSADGQPLAGETGPTLVLRARHREARISVTVTGSAPGLTPGAATASARRDVREGRLAASRPRVAGRPVVGRALRVRTGDWTPGARLRIVWLVDGRKVGTGTRLVVRPALRGERIAVRVVGRLRGYGTVTRTSAPTRAVRRS
ncbi:3',5'-cyclic AMP phosphodiesterase CpdA [Nocardioides exalbidus]|uniref:3',5'-cyclic AMP phosphodiesterase CpdA n=1 Tax=Nocardioides exalbidus TaxID=402596 RepID=A0A1H4JJ55_9ACTN|nr:lamin tail domain-containing protein [Nocardioides exalbidus]SEB46293.1 3',5'-cyclic AMP phosphodiesterase CpdA [Nocardioides exalbidus]